MTKPKPKPKAEAKPVADTQPGSVLSGKGWERRHYRVYVIQALLAAMPGHPEWGDVGKTYLLNWEKAEELPGRIKSPLGGRWFNDIMAYNTLDNAIDALRLVAGSRFKLRIVLQEGHYEEAFKADLGTIGP